MQTIKRRELRTLAGLFTVRDAAEILGISYWAVRRAVLSGAVPRPSARIEGGPRRYFKEDDLAQLRRYFKEDQQCHHEDN